MRFAVVSNQPMVGEAKYVLSMKRFASFSSSHFKFFVVFVAASPEYTDFRVLEVNSIMQELASASNLPYFDYVEGLIARPGANN